MLREEVLYCEPRASLCMMRDFLFPFLSSPIAAPTVTTICYVAEHVHRRASCRCLCRPGRRRREPSSCCAFIDIDFRVAATSVRAFEQYCARANTSDGIFMRPILEGARCCRSVP